MNLIIQKYSSELSSPTLESALDKLYEQWESENHSWSPRTILNTAKSNGGELWLALDDSGELIGFALFRVVIDEAELLYIHVDSNRRRLGVGGKLLTEYLGKFAKENVNSTYLEVRPSNRNAIDLYAKFGFNEVARRPRYYHDGEDAIVMAFATGK